MSVRDISEHLSGLYSVQIGRDTVSRVTEADQTSDFDEFLEAGRARRLGPRVGR